MPKPIGKNSFEVPSQERLMELFHYDPNTGVFTRKFDIFKFKAGEVAGSPHSGGYVSIGVDRKTYLAHRLAWLYVHGKWPKVFIDHINGDRKDNRICNLREATVAQNSANYHVEPRSKSGVRSVSIHKPSGRFRVQIGRENRHVGYFDSLDDAKKAAIQAASKRYGSFAKTENSP